MKKPYRTPKLTQLDSSDSRVASAAPKNGVCCGCGYAEEVETPCLNREDGTHCVHWWEGDGTECEHGSPSCAACRTSRLGAPK